MNNWKWKKTINSKITSDEIKNELNDLPPLNQKPNYKDLKENSAYLVWVSYTPQNIIHEAILFTGFHTGAYWKIYSNTYDDPEDYSSVYFLKIIKPLYKFK